MAATSQPAAETDAPAIAAACDLGAAARSFLHDGMTPDGYLLALGQAGLERDALLFLAHWLEKREALWWGCQCLWHVHRSQPSPKLDAALQTIVAWVLKPNETGRRQCEAVANEWSPAHPVGALGLAAFASTGSLSLPGLPEVAPPATLTASTVAAALQAVASGLPDPRQSLRQFVHLGLDIAHGKNLWS